MALRDIMYIGDCLKNLKKSKTSEEKFMYCRHCGEFMEENQLFCTKCGTEAVPSKPVCPKCGGEVAEGAAFCARCGEILNTKNANGTTIPNTEGIKERSLVTAIILSLVTCGIYAIFWFVSLTNEMNKAAGMENDTSGGVAVLLNLVTCGIYGIYWAYKMGEKRDLIADEKGSSNILYLVLSIFGLGIVVYALLQDTLNKAIANE